MKSLLMPRYEFFNAFTFEIHMIHFDMIHMIQIHMKIG